MTWVRHRYAVSCHRIRFPAMSGPLYVARHAETVLGERGIVNGDPSVDNPLTERGTEQARSLIERLAGVELGLVITTEFPRTKQTADIIVADRSIPREVLADLNDPRQGDFEGKDFELYAQWMDATSIDEPIPGGGESQLDAVRRYARGWREVVNRASAPVLVVAHAFPISVALTLHDEVPPYLRRNYERDPAFAELNVLDAGRLDAGLDRLDAELNLAT